MQCKFYIFRDTVMRTLCEEILSNEFSEPVSCFLLPALSSKSAYEKTFPYVQLISYLSREQNLRTTSWMLYSFLLLEPEHFSKYLKLETLYLIINSIQK